MLLQRLDQAINRVLNAGRYYKNPTEKTVAINLAQIQYFKELAGPVNEYQVGRPVPTKNFQETSIDYSLLNPFFKDGVVPSSSVTNIGVTVWDCNDALDEGEELYDVRLILANYTSNPLRVVKVLPDNKIYGRLNSTLVPPSEVVPVGQYFGNFQFSVTPLPNSISIKYLIDPPDCEIVYTDGEFDPALSTDLLWGSDALTSLFTRTLQYLGINVSNPTIFQEGQQLSVRTV